MEMRREEEMVGRREKVLASSELREAWSLEEEEEEEDERG